MPIQINECKNCGNLPEISYDESNYDFEIYCECKFPKRNNGIGGSLQAVVEDWNERNFYEVQIVSNIIIK